MSNAGSHYSIFRTPMGWMGLVLTDRGVFASVLPQQTRSEAEVKLLARLPFVPGYSPKVPADLERAVSAYFKGNSKTVDIPIDWSWSTAFQRKVLQVVQKIPPGSCLTYGEVARLAGVPGGARAVGGALASNLLPVIIPCHRVVGRTGPGGFTGAGIEVKARLLALEGVCIM